jgi:hypothetical protein
MAFTPSQLADLDAAIASGARVVQYRNGQRVEYRDLDEMLQVRARMTGEIAGRTRQPIFVRPKMARSADGEPSDSMEVG